MVLRLAAGQARLVVFGYNAVTARIGWVHSPVSPQYAGSPLSICSGQVMAYYKDDRAADITEVCGYDQAELSLLEYGGELTVNANYTDHAGNQFTADTRIEVADMEKLRFTALAHAVQKEGAVLDISDAVLSAEYSGGTSRLVDASAATFDPAAGSMIGYMDSLPVQAACATPRPDLSIMLNICLPWTPWRNLSFCTVQTRIITRRASRWTLPERCWR